jgi:aryl-alcohol dehydrogenase-like predicted oxidoreductase
MTESSFSHVDLPHLGTRVLRLGIAGNYGLGTEDMLYAADRGAGFWVWSTRDEHTTTALRDLLARDRERHVVAMFGVAYTGKMVRRKLEYGLRLLGVDHIDVFVLPWLGKMAVLSRGVQKALGDLRREGKIRAVGTSIHDRVRAGKLARDSIIDAFMLRYNAKHPGAEQDVFPHLHHRKPLVISYTATSWRQLLRPIKGIEMPPWPGPTKVGDVPPLDAATCYRFCLGSPHVHVVLTGPASREQLDQNLTALAAGPLTAAEDAWVRDYGRRVKAKRRIPFL